jgi:plasmid stabilization system protein ParE
MSGFVLTPLATVDIFHIWTYIARHNQDAADRVEQAIFDACAFLAEAPMRGHCRPDLTTRPLRFWTLSRYPNYVIVYRPEKAPLQIIAVMQGKKNIRRTLKQRP